MISTARSCRARPAARAAGIALAAVLAVVTSLPSQAKRSDRSKPVDVNAQSGGARVVPNGVSHLKGDVTITQGTLKVTSDDAVVHFDAHAKPGRVVLTGHAHIRQLDDDGKLMTGEADTIDYDIVRGIAVLTGHAHLDQVGRGSVSGDRLVYDTATSAMQAQSSGKHRVHMVFLPQQKPAAPAPAASTAAPSATPAPASTSSQGQP